VCQPRHLLEVGIKGHRVAVARHKRNLQRLARALDRRVRLGELGRKATARRALMCAEVLTHDLLVRERRHRRRRAALREQLQVGGAAQELVHGFWRGALGGSLWLLFYSFPARRSFYVLKDSCPLRMFAPLCSCLCTRRAQTEKKNLFWIGQEIEWTPFAPRRSGVCCLRQNIQPGSAHTPQEPFSHALLGQRARRRLHPLSA
jgi:hypothetical protein